MSLGVVRRIPIPQLTDHSIHSLNEKVVKAMAGDAAAIEGIEVLVAKLYCLTKDDFSQILCSFDKLTNDERHRSLTRWREVSEEKSTSTEKGNQNRMPIPNHYASTLSKMDLEMVEAVPPGGNWKDIPDTVPSQRLRQIRESYSRGEGSRSTYYGRLLRDAPSYTINTYFPRPGNGCHVHYQQDRTLSQREAARLQSFPDGFVFKGNKTQINQQIGNAVPPLLAFQLAKTIPFRGHFVDLFCGAGGLSYGFWQAGWTPIIGNDIERSFLSTYAANIHDRVVAGDIRDSDVFDQLLVACDIAKTQNPELPLIVLGGPPCQGFSTAGNRRTMDDARNWLFKAYKEFLSKVQPTAFVFENVAGLLSIEKGKVFQMIRDELSEVIPTVEAWKLKAEDYAIPQRRTRVVLVGSRERTYRPTCPPVVTQLTDQGGLFPSLRPAISVGEALADLPPLIPGEDGSTKEYLSDPATNYQRLMRGQLTFPEYLSLF